MKETADLGGRSENETRRKNRRGAPREGTPEERNPKRRGGSECEGTSVRTSPRGGDPTTKAVHHLAGGEKIKDYEKRGGPGVKRIKVKKPIRFGGTFEKRKMVCWYRKRTLEPGPHTR